MTKVLTMVGVVGVAIVARLVPHVPNVAPIAGLALFAGAHLPRRVAWLIPLGAMLLSDLILGFHSMMISVYVSYALITVAGAYLKKYSVIKIVGFSLAASVLFFFLTNFNYWSDGSLYPKTLAGLIEAYTMALPFLRNTLIGDLF